MDQKDQKAKKREELGIFRAESWPSEEEGETNKTARDEGTLGRKHAEPDKGRSGSCGRGKRGLGRGEGGRVSTRTLEAEYEQGKGRE